MMFDFLQFAANYVILILLLRLIQAKTRNSEWGKTFALLG